MMIFGFRTGIKRAALLLTLLLFAAPAVFAQKNLVYIDGNIITTGQNAVIGLVNDGAGNMTPLPGSPFLTGGTGVAGTGHPLEDAQWDSDQEIIINPQGTLLFAVNGHSNNISAFHLNANGSLTLAAGSPISSGGTQPSSIGYRDNAFGNGSSLMVVANKDSDPFQTQTTPNFTTFKVSRLGAVTMNAGSTLALPAGSSPAQAMMRPSGPIWMFGVRYQGQNLSSYSINSKGALTLLNSLPLPNAVVGGVFHPTLSALYLTLPPAARVRVISYDDTGTLKIIGSATNQGLAVCWVTVNAAGTRMYTAETMSGTMSVYDITHPQKPVQLQHMAVMGTGALPAHTRLDPTEKFLYIVDRNGWLHVFDVAADGTVSENHLPYVLGVPAGSVPLGLAVLMK